MHDPSGCNSTYNTHDEIRWYDQDSLIFISGLTDIDAIMGNDEKFLQDIEEAAKEKGKQAKENGMKKVRENEKILLDGLSETELCLLRRMLEQITENIDKIPGTSGKMTQRK